VVSGAETRTPPPIDRKARGATAVHRWVVFVALALAGHAALLAASHAARRRIRLTPMKAMEVELEHSAPTRPAFSDKVERKPAPAPRSAKRASAAPPVARAGRLIVQNAGPPKPSDEPVDFVSDPNGKSFGSGVVARAGTADVGAPGARPEGEGNAGAVGATWASENDLSRRPRLAEPDACHGYYPRLAKADRGQALVSIRVRLTGEVAGTRVVSESPAGEGFGAAAVECVSQKVFEPGLDLRGQPVNAAVRVLIRFTR
jgi:periplasmic protein TonB